jgi:hypothetical protein
VPTDTFFNVTRHHNLAGEARIVEFVRVAQAFVRNELDIFAAKRVAVARREVPEGHFERAADLRFQMMHRAGKTVGREPFREGIRLEERAIDFLRPGRQDAVQANGAGHGGFPFGEATERTLPSINRPVSAESA